MSLSKRALPRFAQKGSTVAAEFLMVAFVSLLIISGCAARDGASTDALSGTFTADGVARGVVMSEAECQEVQGHYPDTAVYVVVNGVGECIRYFHAGLGGTTRKAVVFMEGDQIYNRDAVYTYMLFSPARLQARANRNALPPQVGYIELSRPGVRGSSGDHKQRRRARESDIVDAALTAIKNKHGIEKFTLAGESGGGHVAAVLLARRHDIECAVLISATTLVQARYRAKGSSTDFTGYADSVDPINLVQEIPRLADRRVFVVASPSDTNVPYMLQIEYLKAVVAAGHDARLVSATGWGPEGHVLGAVGVAVALACAVGVPSSVITGIAESASGDRTRIASGLREEALVTLRLQSQ